MFAIDEAGLVLVDHLSAGQVAGCPAIVHPYPYRSIARSLTEVEIRSTLTPESEILSTVEEVVSGRADFGIGAADVLISNLFQMEDSEPKQRIINPIA